MKVTFVLPPDYGLAIGGYNVVLQHAAGLAERGHDVEVLHWDPASPHLVHPRGFLTWVRRVALSRRRLRPSLDQPVQRRTVLRLDRGHLRTRDALVATAWRTAGPVAAVGLGPSRTFYFIQHHEVWDGPVEQVNASWRLPLTRIVVSRWLAEIAEQLQALPVHYVPNSVDTESFRPPARADARVPHSVAMLWHPFDWKGGPDGLAAMRLVRQQQPAVQLTLFSSWPPPPQLPRWITWAGHLQPHEVAELLQRTSVFLSPSRSEGWGLPPAEAMAAGCSVVVTDSGGVRDFAQHEVTALVVEPGDVVAIAEAVMRLFRDEPLRERLSRAGRRIFEEELTWWDSTEKLERVLRAAIGAASPAPPDGRRVWKLGNEEPKDVP